MTTAAIHATALVGPQVKLGAGVKIGPYCVVEGEVELGEGVELISHISIAGRTTIGARTQIYPFASIGHPPQDLKYNGEPSRLEIGSDCVIREHVTLNPGTRGGGMVTRVGNSCLLMIGAHIAHDCQIGNNVILSNNAGLAGHCSVGDYAILGGHSGLHQFVRIGPHAFIGGMTKVEADVIPYGMAVGNPAHLGGLNLVGLKRRGFERDALHNLRAAYRLIFSNEGTLRERVEDASVLFKDQPLVNDIIAFIQNDSERRICTPLNGATEE